MKRLKNIKENLRKIKKINEYKKRVKKRNQRKKHKSKRSLKELEITVNVKSGIPLCNLYL